jgi:exodeoxyribonuclease VII large subunit
MREILTVSQLNRAVSGLLERSLPLIWVGGEISNLTRAASGHWYFTLKDAGAQVRAVMFRGRTQGVGFVPREGDRVEVRALVTLYEARGDFQLNVEAMRRAGSGDLHRQFLELKAKLDAEGLFDPARKRALPRLPHCIGVVTSPQAAALRDVLTALARRAPHVPVILYPAPVQGAEAPALLRRALAQAIARGECEVILLVRGGGSIEDLWAFNDEALARDIAASPIPIVAGVGHETDFTIADFVADLRAPTPTAAAELAAVERAELQGDVAGWIDRASRLIDRNLGRAAQRLDLAMARLRPPSEQWRVRAHRLALLETRLSSALREGLARKRLVTDRLHARIRPPSAAAAGVRIEALGGRLVQAARRRVEAADQRLRSQRQSLELVSPLAVLARGYAIVQDSAGRVLLDERGLATGDGLQIRLARAEVEAAVISSRPLPAPPTDERSDFSDD